MAAMENTLRDHPRPALPLADFIAAASGDTHTSTISSGSISLAKVTGHKRTSGSEPADFGAAVEGDTTKVEGSGSTRQQPAQSTQSKRPRKEMEFIFQHQFDFMGIIYYLGTVAGKGSYQNPIPSGHVTVTASSIKRGTRDGLEVCDAMFNQQIFYTDDIPGSWIEVDLHKYSVCLTHYSFAHRVAMPKYFARSWSLQGSMDGKAWTTLREHQNDKTMHPQQFYGHWDVDAKGRYFRKFRILLRSQGNSCFTNALVVSCLELYGRLRLPGRGAG
eukprot:EG_transcript_14735